MARLLNEAEIVEGQKKIPGWTRDGKELVRQYKFADFKEAMAFVNRVAAQAEKMDHHPDILIQYNKVRLSLSTHSAGGLTESDLTLAKNIDTL